MKIYMDTCCYNRPFDDQSVQRIRDEAESVCFTLKRVITGAHLLFRSDLLHYEVSLITDEQRRSGVLELLNLATERVEILPAILSNADDLERETKIRGNDALHLALAEAAGVDVFMTVDDRLYKRVRKMQTSFCFVVANPFDWMRERLKEDQE